MEQPVEEHLYLYPPKEPEWDEDENTLDLMYELYRELSLFLGQYQE